jgi:hypothetical protein
MGVNGGNQTVPTVRFADGSALTNPTIVQVKEHLAAVTTALAAIPAPTPKIVTTSHNLPPATSAEAATSDKLSRSWPGLGWLRRRRSPARP